MRARGGWGESIALVLRDCEPEVRLEFMRSLGQWKRNSMATIQRNSEVGRETFDGDRAAAESRLIKLTALEEELQREMESDARMRSFMRDSMRRWLE